MIKLRARVIVKARLGFAFRLRLRIWVWGWSVTDWPEAQALVLTQILGGWTLRIRVWGSAQTLGGWRV